MGGVDVFATDALRASVLDAWSASPTRFREDANAEEDLRLGGYADAWLVELAQNAADAARAAGVPGRLLVRVVDGELRIANTGAPLDVAGVAALASLRASAKRDDAGAVGRFGVGFAAVLGVTAAPRVSSRDGAVAFSAARTAEAVAALPGGAAAELARRDEPPVLRLVWPSDEDAPPAGYDTEVRLPLRPSANAAALLERARAEAPDLLLALPALEEITVDGRTVRREPGDRDGEVVVGGRRWLLVRSAGTLNGIDIAAEAVEQRARRDWSVCWALPLTADGSPAPIGEDVLHTPTATTETVELPARLIATLPVEADRRRVRGGAATDAVLVAAARLYPDLVRAVEPAARARLVPDRGFPRSPLHGRLRDLVLDALRTAEWLPGVGGDDVAPARAQWLDLPGADDTPLPGLLAAAGLDRFVTGAVPPALGVERVAPAGLVERLFGVEQEPGWWRSVYDALARLVDTVPGLREDLRALPVPLADGRTAAGPPTVLLPVGTPAAEPADPVTALASLALPGLHIAHPDAVHPLLERLGATEAGPAALLEHPALRAAVDRSLDDAEAGLDPAPLATAVLGLVAASGTAPARCSALALPDADGVPTRADELVLPDARVRPLLHPDAPLGVLDAGWAQRLPRAALVAVGVIDGFSLVTDDEPVGPDHELDEEDEWWDTLDLPPSRVVAVRDLDLVDDAAWPAALALLGSGRDTRAALIDPDGYTAWYLARHVLIDGERPAFWRLPSATALADLFDPVPGDDRPDDAVLAAVGVRTTLHVTDEDDAADLLDRLADPERHPDVAAVSAAHVALADAVAAHRVDPSQLDPPSHVRALDGAVTAVDVAVVLDSPWPASVLPASELVAGGDPVVLAELLDLPLATAVVGGTVEGEGKELDWSDIGEVVVACHTLGVDVPEGTVRVHDELWVRAERPVTGRFRVPTWPDGHGGWHAEDPLRALVALLAEPTGS